MKKILHRLILFTALLAVYIVLYLLVRYKYFAIIDHTSIIVATLMMLFGLDICIRVILLLVKKSE